MYDNGIVSIDNSNFIINLGMFSDHEDAKKLIKKLVKKNIVLIAKLLELHLEIN